MRRGASEVGREAEVPARDGRRDGVGWQGRVLRGERGGKGEYGGKGGNKRAHRDS